MPTTADDRDAYLASAPRAHAPRPRPVLQPQLRLRDAHDAQQHRHDERCTHYHRVYRRRERERARRAAAFAGGAPAETGVVPERNFLCWSRTSFALLAQDGRLMERQILQSINLANLYADPKTVVDKPTNRTSAAVVQAFSALGSNLTEGALQSFVSTNFRGEGLELQALSLPEFQDSPAFLGNVSSPLVRAWAHTVHGYWTQLIRGTRPNATCPGGTSTGPCESSLIPLNHTFVVPGGRFREQYYWDSYWIVQGLLQSELYETANATLQNFMDELHSFGFIPNGGRIYCASLLLVLHRIYALILWWIDLNRSQPPLFIRMLYDYVSTTNDTSILRRAFPLAEAELAWWRTNRTISVTSPFTNTTHNISRYAVTNSAPRPESYLQDYTTANDPALPALNESARGLLYAELASGAESGWDYTARWFADPGKAGSEGLRTLRVSGTIPVDLNSILCAFSPFLS